MCWKNRLKGRFTPTVKRGYQTLKQGCQTLKKFPGKLKLLCFVFFIAFLLFELELEWPQPDTWFTRFLRRHSNLTGMKSVALAFGVISFGLSYIESIGVRKVRGVLMGQVIQQFYPWYGVYYVLHGLFVALCLYCCDVCRRDVGLICLLGVFCCSLYTLRMSICVVFSNRSKEKMVSRFIQNYVNTTSECQRLEYACSIAKYIAEQFQEKNLFICSDDKDGLFSANGDTYHLFGLVGLLPKDGNSVQQGSSLAQTIFLLFPTAWVKWTPLGSAQDWFLFYTPAVHTDELKFQEAICATSDIWQSMLDVIDEPMSQAHLVYCVLKMANGKIHPAALCCGLIRFYCIPNSGAPNQRNSFEACADLLVHLLNIQHTSAKLRKVDEEKCGEREFFQTICTEMCLIALFTCVLKEDQDGGGAHLKPLQKTLQRLLRGTGYAMQIHAHSAFYLWYAYVVADSMYTISRNSLLYILRNRDRLLNLWLVDF